MAAQPPDVGLVRKPASFRVQLLLGVLAALFILAGIFLGPITPNISKARQSGAMQTTRTIAVALFQYANDHGGNYPTGGSSTEIFQKLLDNNYVSDPAIFYSPMAGKRPASSPNLTAENVCYDVTVPQTNKTADDVPLVFLTGCRIEYKPGGRALPLGSPLPEAARDGLAIAYHNNNARYKVSHGPSGIVTNVIPENADLGTQTYTQLTPDGPLPPR